MNNAYERRLAGQLHGRGLSINEVSRFLGRSWHTVRDWLEEETVREAAAAESAARRREILAAAGREPSEPEGEPPAEGEDPPADPPPG